VFGQKQVAIFAQGDFDFFVTGEVFALGQAQPPNGLTLGLAKIVDIFFGHHAGGQLDDQLACAAWRTVPWNHDVLAQ
jgi:hypothetical protein